MKGILIPTTYASVIIILSLIIVIQWTPLENPVRDYFADTVTESTVVYVNSTEFIEVIRYLNTTVWINTTEYVYITEYLDYPFVDYWNEPMHDTHIVIYKQNSGSPYRVSYYSQSSLTTVHTDYMSYNMMINTIEGLYSSGYISLQQYDCAQIQVIILQG